MNKRNKLKTFNKLTREERVNKLNELNILNKLRREEVDKFKIINKLKGGRRNSE